MLFLRASAPRLIKMTYFWDHFRLPCQNLASVLKLASDILRTCHACGAGLGEMARIGKPCKNLRSLSLIQIRYLITSGLMRQAIRAAF